MEERIIKRFNRIDNFIRRKATGSPAEFASKLGIAESTLYEGINLMKKLGAPIYYDKSRKSYCYEQTGRFTIEFIFD